MKLNAEQASARDKILTFLTGNTPIFILLGYAGTGKTTLLRTLLDDLKTLQQMRHVYLFAPTGRAAKILMEKTGFGSTIHRGIYIKSDENIHYTQDPDSTFRVSDNSPEYKLIFKVNTIERYSKPIVIVDEASMISSKTSPDDRFQFGSDNLLNDLLDFSGIHYGGQIIFIGDDSQLPPVTDDISAALSCTYFEQRGLHVETASLRCVMRQGPGSVILSNAMSVRENILKARNQRRAVPFTYDDKKFSDITYNEAIISVANRWEDTILITYSNAMALKYNIAIRNNRFPGRHAPVTGDRLLVVKNTYNLNSGNFEEDLTLYNGEFCDLLECSDEEEHIAFVGKEKVNLRFRDVKIRHESGNILFVKIISNLLESPEASLSSLESKALFADFIKRHPYLQKKDQREAFLLALRHDPYFNALQVKYGYAITCHKAQGGEWTNVIVDFTNRNGLDTEVLRWTYTAFTRAIRHLMIVNYTYPSILKHLNINPLSTINIPDNEAYPTKDSSIPPITPYHPETALACKRAKFAEVSQLLLPGEVLEKVISRDWQESYFIKLANKTFRFDATHNKKGLFGPFKLISPQKEPEVSNLLIRLNTPPKPTATYQYTPSTPALKILQQIVTECASQCGITITNIIEGPYIVNYYLFSNTRYKIQFYFNDKGNVTNAFPFTAGSVDNSSSIHILLQKISNCK